MMEDSMHIDHEHIPSGQATGSEQFADESTGSGVADPAPGQSLEQGDGYVVFAPRKPITFDNERIDVLRIDFDSLTGADIEDIEREWAQAGGQAAIVETNKSYLMHVVARASGRPVEAIRAMSARDVSAVTVRAMNFLLA